MVEQDPEANGRLLRDIILALRQAQPHVYRQKGHGRHTQDRIDAEQWLEVWSPVLKLISEIEVE